MKILLIDGDEQDRAYWANRLTVCSPEYQVHEAASGREGLELYRAQYFDCIVLDLVLPDTSGFKLLVDLILHVDRPTVPIVVLTKLRWQSFHELAMRNGAQAALAKDRVSGDDLDRAIRKAVAVVGLLRKENGQLL